MVYGRPSTNSTASEDKEQDDEEDFPAIGFTGLQFEGQKLG